MNIFWLFDKSKEEHIKKQNHMYKTNREIAEKFKSLASIMELHKESPFKTRSYTKAYQVFRKWGEPLCELSHDQLTAIDGVGKAIADKVIEYCTTGELNTYRKYADSTPEGIVELLTIRGLGAKKIRVLWDGLGIENPGDLLLACQENRLVEVKGFGVKTQQNIEETLRYYLSSKGGYLYADIESDAEEVLNQLKEYFKEAQISYIGDIGRKMPVVKEASILTDRPLPIADFIAEKYSDGGTHLKVKDLEVAIVIVDPSVYGSEQVRLTSSDEFWKACFTDTHHRSEEDFFNAMNTRVVPKESREFAHVLDYYRDDVKSVLSENDIRGIVHCHTTYSDGMHTLDEMTKEAERLGYEYIVITDHSKAAFYADGLNEERLAEQGGAIDELNKTSSIQVLKGLECDILSDGRLDMEASVLDHLDVVIASIHSNLSMDKATATKRIITAVENPRTNILGHPTARLLLSRKGYEIDHRKVIDACAANNVAIEVNANPYRLDIDWKWIPYAMERGVYISINPDAHNVSSMLYNHYGTIAARKGGLTQEYCLNARSYDDFLALLSR